MCCVTTVRAYQPRVQLQAPYEAELLPCHEAVRRLAVWALRLCSTHAIHVTVLLDLLRSLLHRLVGLVMASAWHVGASI
jgi:hypothetical protein